jgi:hypothetical protein
MVARVGETYEGERSEIASSSRSPLGSSSEAELLRGQLDGEGRKDRCREAPAPPPQRVGEGEGASRNALVMERMRAIAARRPWSTSSSQIRADVEEGRHREQGWHVEAPCTRPPLVALVPWGGGHSSRTWEGEEDAAG